MSLLVKLGLPRLRDMNQGEAREFIRGLRMARQLDQTFPIKEKKVRHLKACIEDMKRQAAEPPLDHLPVEPVCVCARIKEERANRPKRHLKGCAVTTEPIGLGLDPICTCEVIKHERKASKAAEKKAKAESQGPGALRTDDSTQGGEQQEPRNEVHS